MRQRQSDTVHRSRDAGLGRGAARQVMRQHTTAWRIRHDMTIGSPRRQAILSSSGSIRKTSSAKHHCDRLANEIIVMTKLRLKNARTPNMAAATRGRSNAN
jgi:hypothetical protein